jgi:hypothetical protein
MADEALASDACIVSHITASRIGPRRKANSETETWCSYRKSESGGLATLSNRIAVFICLAGRIQVIVNVKFWSLWQSLQTCAPGKRGKAFRRTKASCVGCDCWRVARYKLLTKRRKHGNSLLMDMRQKDLQILWWSFAWRYVIYTWGIQLLFSTLAVFLFGPLPSPHDLVSEHRKLLIVVDGVWHAFASITALTQSLRLHRWAKHN